MCAPAIPGVPDEAVEAAERAAFDAYLVRNGDKPTTDAEWRAIHASGPTHTKHYADAGLAAAVPHVREQIAREIEAQQVQRNHPAWHDGLDYAADIARGGSR